MVYIIVQEKSKQTEAKMIKLSFGTGVKIFVQIGEELT